MTRAASTMRMVTPLQIDERLGREPHGPRPLPSTAGALLGSRRARGGARRDNRAAVVELIDGAEPAHAGDRPLALLPGQEIAVGATAAAALTAVYGAVAVGVSLRRVELGRGDQHDESCKHDTHGHLPANRRGARP